MLMRIFVSDLHLDDPGSAAFATLEAVLGREAPRAAAIYILGDLCEVWVGDDDDGPFATALIGLLRRTSARCPVFVMRGNRDFLLRQAFADAAGCALIDDPHLLDDGTLLSHGDSLCVDDKAYQRLRARFNSPDWQAEVLATPLAARRALAASMRAESRAANANKASAIMDVNRDAVARLLKTSGAARLVHGHTHRPGIHREPGGARVVLGAWEHCGWLLRQRDEHLDLECFPLGSLTVRCGSGTRGPAD